MVSVVKASCSCCLVGPLDISPPKKDAVGNESANLEVFISDGATDDLLDFSTYSSIRHEH